MKILKLLFSISLLSIFIWNCTSTMNNTSSQERRGPRMMNRNNPKKDALQQNTFHIQLDADDCTIPIEKKLGKKSQYIETIDKANGKRNIVINGVASHSVGMFPNPGNPNTIQEHKASFAIPLHPKLTAKKTYGQGYDTGVLFSGVVLEPFTAEFFIAENGRPNREWNMTTLSTTEDLGLDCNNAHVQPTGRYHYHGTPSAFIANLEVDGSKMVKIGYASDGFPMYYKYGYDKNGTIIAHKSGYELKKGQRPGDGKTAPNGYYNGRYFNDYEYRSENSLLDECNGRWGKTPENDYEYYYVVTDNFPSIPLCFSGTPSTELRKGGARPEGRNRPPHHNGQHPPRRF